MELDGKVAIVTGGGGGIGAALTEALVARNVRVVVTDLVADGLDRLRETTDASAPGSVATIAGSPPSATRPSTSTQSASNPFVSTLGKTPSAPVRSDP